ncbi:hypothetical protein ABZ929_06390 [Streptomyces physcomitrii]|uniref:hypothetical protein n=1 Tax=Streptomyces physcomitrii TaxID=2724184 RepID=UPI0033D3E9F1
MSDLNLLSVLVPEDWVTLPGAGTSLSRWSRATAEELAARGRAAGHPMDTKPLRADLKAWAKDSLSRAPLSASLYYPDGFEEALALVEVQVFVPDETLPVITLDWLAETFGASDFGPPEVTRVEVPTGPAVRIRQNLAVESAGRRTPGVLRETLTYGMLPHCSTSAVMLMASWSAPGVAGELEAVVDEIARRLEASV